MDFRLIDYSLTHYGKSLPPLRSGKFVQVVDHDDEVESLILSPYELSKYHAQILERFCFLNEIEGRFIKMPDFYQVTGADIEVVGGGHWKIDGRTLRLTGESTMYGRFDPQGLSDRIRSLPEYRAFVVTVA